jgi:hypothetical protein
LPYEFGDAAAALRGYAMSELNGFSSSVIFSAGFNPQLYGYIANFPDFFPTENGEFKKKVCLKVSDYRSAEIQGKYLAKHGVWVSEYRVESPLNCGGHAFINNGQLMGPILEEFKQKRDELRSLLHVFYKKAVNNLQRFCADEPYDVIITAQGGIGNSAEHNFLLDQYGLAAAGWGSPFLLVPEATNVDDAHLKKLLAAKEGDIFLSSSSPLGVPFWNLRNSASEESRLSRIRDGVCGACCVKGFARLTKEFGEKLMCRASHEYQKFKLELSEKLNLPIVEREALKEDVLSKSCICNDLAGGATLKNGIDKAATSAICPGPNIINFKKIMTLKEMIDHIYGRRSVLPTVERANLFITEIKLQMQYLSSEIQKAAQGLPTRSSQKLNEVKLNLLEGISYYQNLAKTAFKEHQENFLSALKSLQAEIESIRIPETCENM